MEPREHDQAESLQTILDRITHRFMRETQDAPPAPPQSAAPLPMNGHQAETKPAEKPRYLPSPWAVSDNHLSGIRQQTSVQQQALQRAFDTVRPELNISKHADFLFAPSHSKNLHKPRSRNWDEILPDGTKVKASLYIEPFRNKTYTTKTYRVLLGLQKLLEQKGWNENEQTVYSERELAKNLGIRWHGNKTGKELYHELSLLRGVLGTWKYSFKDNEGKLYTILDHFNILDTLKVLKREDRNGKEKYEALNVFRFSEPIRNNLKANRRKPTNISVILNIKSEIASVLYARLDIILADKNYYEVKTKKLFVDLYLTGEKEYLYPSGRKRKLDRAIKELDQKQISTGILNLHIEKTTDGTDYKLVAQKLPFNNNQQKRHVAELVEPANPPEAVALIIQDIKDGVSYHRPDRDKLFHLMCACYDAELIYRALGEYKADGHHARHPLRYFLFILHRIAHARGLLWLGKQCPCDCKHYTHKTNPPQ